MGSDIRELEAIAEAKDQEIQKLSSKIKRLEIDLASAPNVPEVLFSDANIGDTDVRDEMWIASQDFETLKEGTQKKSDALSELRVQCVELQASLGANERKLVSMEEMHTYGRLIRSRTLTIDTYIEHTAGIS